MKVGVSRDELMNTKEYHLVITRTKRVITYTTECLYHANSRPLSKGKEQGEMKKFWTVKEVANYFNVTESGVRKWVRTGKLDCIKIESRVRFTDDQINEFETRARRGTV